MRILMVIFNILAFFGGFLLLFWGGFYATAILCVPFYATFRAITEKEPTTKKRYTIVSIASSFTLLMCILLTFLMSH